MPKMIFVNLPVTDVAKSTAFYESLGAKRDPRFCNETTSMMTFSEHIHVMLLTHERFREFTAKPIADSKKTTEVLLCLSEDSRAAVDATAEEAIAAGGKADPCVKQDYGFMYGRSFEDLDGHIFEVVWMDVEAAMKASTQPATAQAQAHA
ncbi:MAG: VOC family protein [Myxococcota bacterium]|nr:VOC family protein [Myxococcota bacterium]